MVTMIQGQHGHEERPHRVRARATPWSSTRTSSWSSPGSGVIGKIARCGDIPIGYYNDPEKTAEVFITVDGVRYVMPGDFATVEADGSVTLLGRGSVCINSGGEKIFPEEVESAVRSHPDVIDAIVVGRPRRALGPDGWPPSSSPGPAAPASRTSRPTAGGHSPATRSPASSMWSRPSCGRRAASPTTGGPRSVVAEHRPRPTTEAPVDGGGRLTAVPVDLGERSRPGRQPPCSPWRSSAAWSATCSASPQLADAARQVGVIPNTARLLAAARAHRRARRPLHGRVPGRPGRVARQLPADRGHAAQPRAPSGRHARPPSSSPDSGPSPATWSRPGCTASRPSPAPRSTPGCAASGCRPSWPPGSRSTSASWAWPSRPSTSATGSSCPATPWPALPAEYADAVLDHTFPLIAAVTTVDGIIDAWGPVPTA